MAFVLTSCGGDKGSKSNEQAVAYSDRRDYHSYANASEVRIGHVELDLTVDFNERKLKGFADLHLVAPARDGQRLLLDTRDLTIAKVEATPKGVNWSPTSFQLGKADAVLGTPLEVSLPTGTQEVRVTYETSPNATALQWLTPAQTADKKAPFLFTQSQAIHARSWIPLQDTPSVRQTYSARIRVPAGLMALMSAENPVQTNATGEYEFRMPQPIPSYLIALAVGNLEYRPISRRTGVYAEPSVVNRAKAELSDLEQMVAAAESLYGPYRWEQFDVLFLPPSFPFGGMENPRLTFATPTLLAGDKSLVAVIAHELAHSWSGNLVTNATWRDFWLNEGFTTYFERRIQEEVYGRDRAEMEALIQNHELLQEMAELPERDEILYVDLKGRDPDAGFTQVPYVKGALFLRRLEEVFGQSRFDAFLRGYFSSFAFQSIVTGQFVDYLKTNLFASNSELAGQIELDRWLSEPGLLPTTPEPQSQALTKVGGIAEAWVAGRMPLSQVPAARWTTPEWMHFIRALPHNLSTSRMAELDSAFHLTRVGNAEVLHEWLLLSIRTNYEPAFQRLERFLTEVGRRKFLKPLYTELAKSDAGRRRAAAIFAKARHGYHPIAVSSVQEVLK
jgi:leukotriene A-4 hydrolase/aminopeptidase